jgi:hypothetical protein
MTADDAVGADHNAGPTADAFAGIGDDDVLNPTDGPGNAGMEAGGFFTMPAEDRQGLVWINRFHIDPTLGLRGLRDGLMKGFALGMFDGASPFTGMTTQAPIQPDEYFFGLGLRHRFLL